MGKVLQVRVWASTYRDEDVEKAWPLLVALAWPEPFVRPVAGQVLGPADRRGVLELVLNNGVSGMSGLTDGLETGDPAGFAAFDDFYDAVARQLTFNVERSVKIAEIGDAEAMKRFQHPFVSAMLDGCMEAGKDHVCGGAKYNFSSITAYGFATLVNSLYIIKKAVYEDHLVSLPELVGILNTNFEGQEILRQKLIRKYAKWGNDQAEIDEFACRLWDLFTREVAKYVPLRGGRYNAGAYSMGVHVIEGFVTKPTPDGRKAFDPISNSLSPVNGTEANGISAVLNSLAKLNYDFAANGVAVNVRIHPQNLEKDENIDKFYRLLKTYFQQGGMQLQVNVLDAAQLRAAKADPSAYPGLLVRVSGYCAYFRDLSPAVQEEIIEAHGARPLNGQSKGTGLLLPPGEEGGWGSNNPVLLLLLIKNPAPLKAGVCIDSHFKV